MPDLALCPHGLPAATKQERGCTSQCRSQRARDRQRADGPLCEHCQIGRCLPGRRFCSSHCAGIVIGKTVGHRNLWSTPMPPLDAWGERPCSVCGIPFRPRRVNGTLCSDDCRRARGRQLNARDRERCAQQIAPSTLLPRLMTLDCWHCDTPFTAYSQMRRYCSAACSTATAREHARRRRGERLPPISPDSQARIDALERRLHARIDSARVLWELVRLGRVTTAGRCLHCGGLLVHELESSECSASALLIICGSCAREVWSESTWRSQVSQEIGRLMRVRSVAS